MHSRGTKRGWKQRNPGESQRENIHPTRSTYLSSKRSHQRPAVCVSCHRRLFKYGTKTPYDEPTNYCFEVTVLDMMGERRKIMSMCFLNTSSFACAYVNKSQSNLIINCMRLEHSTAPANVLDCRLEPQPTSQLSENDAVVRLDDTPESSPFLKKSKCISRTPILHSYWRQDCIMIVMKKQRL
jgi:hypothetical protein